MCDDGCDELVCCICAPLAAIFCCKFCKDRKGRTSVHQSSSPALYNQPTDHMSEANIYGQRSYPQPQIYPDRHSHPNYASHNHPMHGNHLPPHQVYTHHDLPSVHAKQPTTLYR